MTDARPSLGSSTPRTPALRTGEPRSLVLWAIAILALVWIFRPEILDLFWSTQSIDLTKSARRERGRTGSPGSLVSEAGRRPAGRGTRVTSLGVRDDAAASLSETKKGRPRRGKQDVPTGTGTRGGRPEPTAVVVLGPPVPRLRKLTGPVERRLRLLLRKAYRASLEAESLSVHGPRSFERWRLRGEYERLIAKFDEEILLLRTEQGPLLHDLGALEGIWKGCFSEFQRRRAPSPEPAWHELPGLEGEYLLRPPARYHSGRAWPLILYLPETESSGRSAILAELEGVYPADSPGLASTMLVTMSIPASLRDSARGVKHSHALAHWLRTLLRGVIREYRIDRDRVFLDASGNAVPLALASLNVFADSLAGIILRQPPKVARELLSNPLRIPTLVLGNRESWASTELLLESLGFPRSLRPREAIERNVPRGSGRILVRSALPFPPMPWIAAAWTRHLERRSYRRRLHIRTDIAKGNVWDWVRVVPHASADDRPAEIRVHLDESTNALVVRAMRNCSVTFQLNGSMLDLQRPVTIDVPWHRSERIDLGQDPPEDWRRRAVPVAWGMSTERLHAVTRGRLEDRRIYTAWIHLRLPGPELR